MISVDEIRISESALDAVEVGPRRRLAAQYVIAGLRCEKKVWTSGPASVTAASDFSQSPEE